MDANKLICKIFSILENKAYAEMYGVECMVEEDSLIYRNLLWMLQSGCPMSKDIECYIEKVISDIGTIDEFDSIASVTCSISLSKTSSAAGCSNPPQLSVA